MARPTGLKTANDLNGRVHSSKRRLQAVAAHICQAQNSNTSAAGPADASESNSPHQEDEGSQNEPLKYNFPDQPHSPAGSHKSYSSKMGKPRVCRAFSYTYNV